MINSDGQNYGPYSADKVREFIRWGVFRMEDFAFIEGSKTWLRVVEVLQGALMPSAPMPSPSLAPQPYAQSSTPSPIPINRERRSKLLNPKKTKVIIRSGSNKYGPYNLNQVQAFLQSGKFQESDTAWSAPLASWVTIGELMDHIQVPDPQSRRPARPGSSSTTNKTYSSYQASPQTLTQLPPQAPPPPAAPKRRVSGADIMSASSRNFGASF